MIQFEGTPALQDALRALCREFIDIFSTAVRPLPARVQSMVIEIDRTKWELPSNRLPQRHHSAEKQTAIRLREAECGDGGIRRLADSEYSTNTVAIGNNETNGVRPPGFHSGLPPDTT